MNSSWIQVSKIMWCSATGKTAYYNMLIYNSNKNSTVEDEHKIAEAMHTMKGSAILTINDHPEMQKIFKGFDMETVNINYTIGGAGKGKNRRELIYKNW